MLNGAVWISLIYLGWSFKHSIFTKASVVKLKTKCKDYLSEMSLAR